MKKTLLYGFLCGLVLAALYHGVSSATTQAQSLGVSDVYIKSKTVAQIAALTPLAVGELIFCSNCTAGSGRGVVCVSTGTATGAIALSTGTVCR